MTTAIGIELDRDAEAQFADMVPAREGGILARVRRPCAEHGGECRCVGHLEEEGCLVFWCVNGEHFLTFR